jgi:rubrerythrin
MDISALFLLFLVVAIVTLFITRPVRTAQPGGHDDQLKSVLLAERERVLNSLSELDADQQLGKIPEEDYQPQRTLLVERGADVLRRLDGLAAAQPEARKARQAPPLKKGATKAAAGVVDDEALEDLLARRRSALREKTAGFCPGCGKPVLKSDKFCPACGRAIA